MNASSPRTGVIVLSLAALLVPCLVHAQTGTLFVEGSSVGIGIASPERSLHVFSSVDTTLRVENANPTTKGRIMMELRNNGGVNFIMIDDAGHDWQFLAETQTGTPGFSISRQASGVREFRVDPNGNLFTSGAVNPSSSRSIKEGFAEVDPAAILAKLDKLPIQSWIYRSDAGRSRHLGPFSEDFHELFALGTDDAHISLGDVSGVALVAAQELYRQSQEKDRRLAELEAHVERLEELVEQLTSSVEARN